MWDNVRVGWRYERQADPNRNRNCDGVCGMANDSLYCGTAPEGKGREVWKPVPSEPGVMASTWGRILLAPSYAPLARGGYRLYAPKPSPGVMGKAAKHAKHTYRFVMLPRRAADGPRQRPRKVHQLVCEAFHGPKPFARAVVIHADENAHNNRPENLRWGTQKENLNAPGFLEYCRARTGENSPHAKHRARQAEQAA